MPGLLLLVVRKGAKSLKDKGVFGTDGRPMRNSVI